MKLNKTEAKVLAYVTDNRERISLTKLAERLNIKKSNASRYVKKLESYRLITASKIGRAKEIRGSHHLFLSFSKAREKLPQIRLEDLLTGKMPHFLAYLHWYVRKRLNERKPVIFRIKDIDLPAITTKRLLMRLSGLGIAYQPSKGAHSTRKEAYEALRFCAEMLTGIYVAEAEVELKGIVGIRISFENPERAECIFITEKENNPKNYWPTAYTTLDKYGVKLISAGKYYYANVKPEIADIAIHMLALGSDVRSLMYVSALLIKNRFDYRHLTRKENKFGVSDALISALIRFVETRGREAAEGFPSWQEVEAVTGQQAGVNMHG